MNKNSGEAEFSAASVVAAKELARAGVPLSVARSEMQKGAYAGAAKNGYDINSWPMGGVYKSKIDGGIEAALQGYQPAKQGEVQGPPSPAQQRSEAPPFGSFIIPVAGGRDVGAPPAVEPGQPGQLPGRSEWESSRPGPRMGQDPNVVIEDPAANTPPPPPPAFQAPGRPGIDPDIFPLQQQEQDLQQQLFDPRAQRQASLLDFLQNFNPISTAEARSARSQPGQLTAAAGRDGAALPGGLQRATMDLPPIGGQPGAPEWAAPGESDVQYGDITDAPLPPDAPAALQPHPADREGPPATYLGPPPGLERQASLLDFLQNFNPISTAEARSARSQPGQLTAPRADPGTIQSRLSEARSNVIDDLQTNQGLRNTLDLIVTGEVGSQGKAAVLGIPRDCAEQGCGGSIAGRASGDRARFAQLLE